MIVIDNIMIDHVDKFIKDVGWIWDHSEQRNKIAQSYLIANYVFASGKHNLLEFKRFKKREQCQATAEKFEGYKVLLCQLVDWVNEYVFPGDFAFDNYFTNGENLNYFHSRVDRRWRSSAYMGDLKFNRQLKWKRRICKADELVAQHPAKDRKEIQYGAKRHYYFTCTAHIPKGNQKVGVLVLWHQKRDSSTCKVLATNRILGIYKKRWTEAETFFQVGKQELRIGDCQLRDGQGLAMLADSLLISQIRPGRAHNWVLQKLMTIGETCPAMLHETLSTPLTWAIRRPTEFSWSGDQVIQKHGLT